MTQRRNAAAPSPVVRTRRPHAPKDLLRHRNALAPREFLEKLLRVRADLHDRARRHLRRAGGEGRARRVSIGWRGRRIANRVPTLLATSKGSTSAPAPVTTHTRVRLAVTGGRLPTHHERHAVPVAAVLFERRDKCVMLLACPAACGLVHCRVSVAVGVASGPVSLRSSRRIGCAAVRDGGCVCRWFYRRTHRAVAAARLCGMLAQRGGLGARAAHPMQRSRATAVADPAARRDQCGPSAGHSHADIVKRSAPVTHRSSASATARTHRPRPFARALPD